VVKLLSKQVGGGSVLAWLELVDSRPAKQARQDRLIAISP